MGYQLSNVLMRREAGAGERGMYLAGLAETLQSPNR